jgi:hypothetical protein
VNNIYDTSVLTVTEVHENNATFNHNHQLTGLIILFLGTSMIIFVLSSTNSKITQIQPHSQELILRVKDDESDNIPQFTSRQIDIIYNGRTVPEIIDSNGIVHIPTLTLPEFSDTFLVNIRDESWRLIKANQFVYLGDTIIVRIKKKIQNTTNYSSTTSEQSNTIALYQNYSKEEKRKEDTIHFLANEIEEDEPISDFDKKYHLLKTEPWIEVNQWDIAIDLYVTYLSDFLDGKYEICLSEQIIKSHLLFRLPLKNLSTTSIHSAIENNNQLVLFSDRKIRSLIDTIPQIKSIVDKIKVLERKIDSIDRKLMKKPSTISDSNRFSLIHELEKEVKAKAKLERSKLCTIKDKNLIYLCISIEENPQNLTQTALIFELIDINNNSIKHSDGQGSFYKIFHIKRPPVGRIRIPNSMIQQY